MKYILLIMFLMINCLWLNCSVQEKSQSNYQEIDRAPELLKFIQNGSSSIMYLAAVLSAFSLFKAQPSKNRDSITIGMENLTYMANVIAVVSLFDLAFTKYKKARKAGKKFLDGYVKTYKKCDN